MVSELAYPRQEPVGNDWVGNSVSVKSPNPFRPVAADYGGDFVLQFRTAIHRRWQRLRAQALLRPAALPRLIRSPTRPYSSSGFGGGNDRCMVKVPDIDPSKIPKPASISGKMTKSMVRYEADASDPTAVWRVVHLRPSEEPRELPDQVPPDELEIEKTRSVEDLWQINLNSTQGIQPMGAPEGNLNSPLAGFSVVVTGWEQDSKDSDEVVGKHEVRLDEVIDGLDGAVSGDFGIPSWLFRTPDYMAPEQWNHQKPNQQVNSNPSNCRAPSFFKSLAKGPILDSPEFVGGEPLVEALDSPELVVGEPLVGAVVQKKETTMKSCTTGACKYCGYKWVIGHKCKQSQLVNLMAGDVSDEAPFDLTQLYVVGRADQRLRGTGLFWKLPPWPDFCTMNCDRFAQHCEYEVIEKFYSVKQYNHSALDYTDKFEELIKIWPDLSLCEVYWMAKGMQKELYGLQDLGEDEPIGLTDVETSQLSISASRCGVKNRRVGQQCLAIENPFGFDPTLTVGVISGLNRDIFSKAGVTIEDGAHFHMKQASVVMNSTVSSSKKYFNDRSVPAIEMKIKKLMPMDDESKRLTDWVGKSVYDALQKKDAKFFIIKSYSEDDVHKSVKYNVWASTPNGNKKLDAGYREAREKLSECPVFLFFFVNTSVQFVGVAEMISPVDFDKTVDYWQQDKWNGCFPVTWHIVKDVPNNILKHITLDHNDNKPVTHCHDTQKVKLEQCLEMLKIFKDHVSKTSLMDGLFNSGRTAVAKKLFKSLKVLYKLQLPEGVEIHPGFHDSQLKIHCSPKAISSSDLSLVSKDSKLNTEPISVLENSVVTQWLIPWKNLLPDDASGNNADFIKGAFPGLYSHTINSWVPDQILEDKYYLEEKLLRLFASGSRAVLSSMAMRFGGIVGQKVMKVCYGKLHPNYQFFYFDSVESLPVEPLESGDLKPESTRCAAQVSVFGSKLRKKLEQAKIFMGGSGALGCEFLKNLALMGISCSPDGKLVVSDDDVIEKSNLSRQYLFCDWNSGQPKSTVAATCKRGFVQFYHEPIKQIIKTCMNDQRDKLWPMWRKLGVTMKTDEKELMGKALIKSVQHTVVWKGKKQESVEDVLCGNIVAIVGLKQFIANSANLAIEKETDACPIKTMEFSVFPVVRVTVQCQFAFHLPKLVGSLKLNVLADNCGVKSNRMSVIYPMNGHFQNGHGVAPNGLDGKTGFVSKILEGRAVAALNKFDKNSKMMSDPMWMRRLQPTLDPMVLCTIKESGEQICAGIGELHFEICLKILLKMLHGKVLVSLKVHFQHSIHKPVALDLLISILEDKYAVKGEEMSDSADL